jgi:CarD family transcriptional regulator
MATKTPKKTTAKTAKTPAKAKPKKAAPTAKVGAKKATPAKKVVAKKAPTKKAPAAKKAAPAKKAAAAKKATPAKKVVAKKAAPAKKAPAVKKAAPKKVTAAKPGMVRKATPVKKKATTQKAPPAKKAAPVKAAAPKSPPPKKLGNFACGDFVVYPTHGVGQISAIVDQEVAGYQLRLFVVQFEKEKMTLRIPVGKAEEAGLRKLATRQMIDIAITTLKGRSKVNRAMWSRRAQEYEAKINSGDPVSIAEVVRDLHRNAGQPDQSYSERQIYEAALERLAREVAAVDKTDWDAATMKLEGILEAPA